MDMNMVAQRLEQSITYYTEQLARYDMEQLTRKPGEEQWSLGQMYNHLIGSALGMQFANIDECIRQSEQQEQAQGNATHSEAQGKTDIGTMLFAKGSFPPEPVRVPPHPAYTPQQPMSREQLQAGLQQVRSRIQPLAARVQHIPSHYTVRHPRLGDLTATEWFMLTEMHYRHHLHQKRRLDEFLQMEHSRMDQTI
ncbi:DinB family protein [Paenibacillus kandeliae]|uniref:DinB family protein n=1 Tax=Paenibacillus kandeliae TaxID=3231269 RepID=UPI003458ED2F